MSDIIDDVLELVYGENTKPVVEWVRVIEGDENLAGKADWENNRILLAIAHCIGDTRAATVLLHEIAHLLTSGGHSDAFWAVNRALLAAYGGVFLARDEEESFFEGQGE